MATALMLTADSFFPIRLAGDDPPPTPTPDPPVMVVLGDSFSAILGAEGPNGWPARVANAAGATLVNQAHSGSGYVNSAASTFPYEAATSAVPADVYVVFGGLNDLGHDPEAVREAAVVTYRLLRYLSPGAALVVIGPQWPADWPQVEQMWPYRDAIRSAALDAGARYVDALHWFDGRPECMWDDGKHPNEAYGQRRLGELITPHVLAALHARQETR